MNGLLRLAAEFIERAVDPTYGIAANEEFGFGWVCLREADDPLAALNLSALSEDDVEALSIDAWVWLGTMLGEADPELPATFASALFQSVSDPLHRLRVADMTLRHPRLVKRYGDAPGPLSELPHSWAQEHLVRLAAQPEQGEESLEMVEILLQVGNNPALRLLAGFRQEQEEMVDQRLQEQAELTDQSLEDLQTRLGLIL